MDKKSKKRLELINKKLQLLRQKHAGAKQQDDEPGELERLEREIAEAEAEVKRLKES